MKWLALAFLMLAALPAYSAETAGSFCTIPIPTGEREQGVPTCRVLLNASAAGAISQTPIFVPAQAAKHSVIRVVKAASLCTWDDIAVSEGVNTVTAAGTEWSRIGYLDDDGTAGGTAGAGGSQVKVFGPVGPYIRISGTLADTGTECEVADSSFVVYLLSYPEKPGQP